MPGDELIYFFLLENPLIRELAHSHFFQSEMKTIEQEESVDNPLKTLFLQHTILPQHRLKRKDGKSVFLTGREAKCLYYLTEGQITKEIAQHL